MADEPTDAPEQEPQAPVDEEAPKGPADTIDWKNEARRQERETKKLRTELEQLRQASMSDQEKAVAAAREEGRKEAAKQTGVRLVDAEVRACAAGRKVDVDALLDGLDRSRFLTDDGEPDTKQIAAWVERIAPASANGAPDLGQGTRSGGSPDADMNSLLRRAAGRA